MARITDLTALTSPATNDVAVIVDVSDSTQSANGTTKQIMVSNLLALVQAPASPQALSNSTAITVNTAYSLIPLTATGAVTGITMPTAGLQSGQTVTLVNQSAYSVTFAASGTSNVADGTSDVIAANTAGMYVWDGNTSLWYRAS